MEPIVKSLVKYQYFILFFLFIRVFKEFIQVHEIYLGKSMFINHITDMVMIHFKLKQKKDDPTPIYQNQFVQHALNRELF